MAGIFDFSLYDYENFPDSLQRIKAIMEQQDK